MTIGSFDEPATIPLQFQVGMEGRLPQIDQLADLKNYGTTEEDETGRVIEIKASNRQHPDHETIEWSVKT